MAHDNLSGFIGSAQRLLNSLISSDEFGEMLKEKQRLGGYLCVARPDGVPLLVASLGTPNEEKIPLYIEFCQEKARRLAEHPDHRRSMESREPEVDRWGGAVRGTDFIVSFSGLPEELDEVLSAMTLYEMLDIDLDALKALLAENTAAARINVADYLT